LLTIFINHYYSSLLLGVVLKAIHEAIDEKKRHTDTPGHEKQARSLTEDPHHALFDVDYERDHLKYVTTSGEPFVGILRKRKRDVDEIEDKIAKKSDVDEIDDKIAKKRDLKLERDVEIQTIFREIRKLLENQTQNTSEEQARLTSLLKHSTRFYDKDGRVIPKTRKNQIHYKIIKYDNLLGLELKTTKEDMDKNNENDLFKHQLYLGTI